MLSKEYFDNFKKDEKKIVEKAFDFAYKIHKGQKRKSGDPYIVHPLAVGKILSLYDLDAETIAAGLLHDTVEDGDVSIDELEQEFGSNIANLVEGVTSLGKVDFDNIQKKETDEEKRERKIEGLRKLFLAMAGDLRVVLIKLADRLNNMRTLSSLGRVDQIRIAKETMEVYAPLANRLGMGDLKGELETLSFKYLLPDEYKKLLLDTKEVFKKKEKTLKEMENYIGEKIKDANIKFEIGSRVKQYYSIYKKLKKTGGDLSKIYDLMAIRIVVDEVEDCYKTLGIIHSNFKPLIYRIKDYIAVPKPNGYRSLHTTVFGLGGKIYEIQIRTKQMHLESIKGISAHWNYDENKKSGAYINGDHNKSLKNTKMDWVKELITWQETAKNNEEFLKGLKIDVFKDRIFVFSPSGEVYDLPEGATPVDFAFSVHSEIGKKMSGAKVNGKIFPIDGKLENRDIVEVITAKNSKGPKRDWLSFVVTSKAKHCIRLFLKAQNREERVSAGRKLLEDELKFRDLSLDNLQEDLKIILKKIPYKTEEDMLAAIGDATLSLKKIANLLAPPELIKKAPKIRSSNEKESIEVLGLSGVLIKIATCCNPVKGDEIRGFITRGKGVTVHKKKCKNLLRADKERVIDASWIGISEVVLNKDCEMVCEDRVGLLADVSGFISAAGLNILSIKVVQQKDKSQVKIDLKVTGKENEQFKSLARRLDLEEEIISYNFR